MESSSLMDAVKFAISAEMVGWPIDSMKSLVQ